MRRLYLPFLALLASVGHADGQDYLPGDHGLRYVGHEGIVPVTVEITLQARPDGTLDYAQWVAPRGWASWFGQPAVTRTHLQFRDDLLVPLGYDAGQGEAAPPAGLATGSLDALAVRLRARADIARGLRHAEYAVWNGGAALETWVLEVGGAETVQTPNGAYQALKFRLGSEHAWIEGWSAPLLVFHFVKLVSWQNGKKISELSLDDKQL